MKTHNLNISLLTEGERAKIEHYDWNQPNGLYGQFLHLDLGYTYEKDQRSDLFQEAEATVLTILEAKEFDGFRAYCDGPASCAFVGPSLDVIIKRSVTMSQVTILWSIQQPNNRNLMLMVVDKKLHLCTAEYAHQSNDIVQGIHWYRTYERQQREEFDSFRLHQALMVLANPKMAWTHLRARVHAIELSYRG